MRENKPLSGLRIVTHRSGFPRFSLKQRLVALGAATLLFGMFGAVATVQEQDRTLVPEWVVEPLSLSPSSFSDSSTPLYWYEEALGRTDTFADLLTRLQIRHAEVARLIADYAVERVLARLQPGMTVRAQVTRSGDLHALRFLTATDTLATIEFVEGRLTAAEQPVRLDRRVVSRSAIVGNSIFGATDAAGLPDRIAMQLPEVFGGDFDFNKDMRRGDRFSAVYEVLSYEGREVRPGRLLAAEVIHAGLSHRAVWFQSGDIHGYYRPDGQSLHTAFLRSPLDFSRITSGFELRYDPWSQKWTTHKGIDFAAPTGTPVKATAEGTVEFAGQQNGYGNVVILKHESAYSTLYAHLSAFADGMRVGDRIGQGQLLGYVGQTGWATGPHLHYEFRIHGEYVNPFSVALPTGSVLDPARLAQFKTKAEPLLARLELLKHVSVASAE